MFHPHTTQLLFDPGTWVQARYLERLGFQELAIEEDLVYICRSL